MSHDSFVLGADGIYRSPLFEQFGWLWHGFGTRRANAPAAVTLRQVHSDRALNAAGLADREAEGDADEPVDEKRAEQPRRQVGLAQPALGAGRQDHDHRSAGSEQERDQAAGDAGNR